MPFLKVLAAGHSRVGRSNRQRFERFGYSGTCAQDRGTPDSDVRERWRLE